MVDKLGVFDHDHGKRAGMQNVSKCENERQGKGERPKRRGESN